MQELEMSKKNYQELLRLRRQEETYIYMALVVRPDGYSVRDLFEAGYFGSISRPRLENILLKFEEDGLYEYGVSWDLGKLIKDIED